MSTEGKFLTALIPNKYYHHKAIFEQENLEIFQKCWYYVGLTTSLQNHNDFITADIGGISVVVQNFKGQLKAFQNICTHRFNKIQTEREGNRPLACQYHNWNYNEVGIPFGIPLKKEFEGLDKDALQELCLKNFLLATCGKFVFVKISEDTETLDQFLGNTAAYLLKISEMLGKRAEYFEIPNKANWKIVVENTLEGYHISSVHPFTFFKQGFNLKSTAHFETSGLHTNMLLGIPENAEPDKKRERLKKMLKNRPFQPDGFFHQLIFPNLSIGSLFGFTCYIGSIQAIAHDQSVFAYELFETNLGEGNLLDDAVSEVLGAGSIEFTRTTLAEDRAICENVQRGVSQTNAQKGVLNSLEVRIWEFQKAYLSKMNKPINE